MQHEHRTSEGSWGFRSFLIVVGLLILGFIGWLIYAIFEYAPNTEKDVLRTILALDVFRETGLAITNQPSKCETTGEVKGAIAADLYQSFVVANSKRQGTLPLNTFRQPHQVLDGSKTALRWYIELKRPVLAISNIGLVGTRALACLELHGPDSVGSFVMLEHAGADYWRLVNSQTTWQRKSERAEEIPELKQMIVD